MNTFSNALQKGEEGERFLDNYFSPRYKIESVDFKDRFSSVDRIFVHRRTKAQTSVEYKTDYKAAKTKKFFLELIANSEKNSPGWVYSTLAQVIVFYIPDSSLILSISTGELRRLVKEWINTYKQASCYNPRYHSVGLLVPVDVLKSHSLVGKLP